VTNRLLDDAVAEPLAGSASAVPEGDSPRSSRLLYLGIGLILLFVVVRLFVAEPMITHGISMEPTLHDGDALVVEKVSAHFSDPTIGDVVVANAPDTGEPVVKRVVALAGDSVGIEDGVLIRNGVPVREAYTNAEQMGGYYWGPEVVPAGSVFLLGDNRLESHDSRAYGAVPVDAISGYYLVRVWPF
jgi:signal peptidase I